MDVDIAVAGCPISVTIIAQVDQALIGEKPKRESFGGWLVKHRGDDWRTFVLVGDSGHIIGVIVASLSILQRAGTASWCILAPMLVATKSFEAGSAGVSALTYCCRVGVEEQITGDYLCNLMRPGVGFGAYPGTDVSGFERRRSQAIPGVLLVVESTMTVVFRVHPSCCKG